MSKFKIFTYTTISLLSFFIVIEIFLKIVYTPASLNQKNYYLHLINRFNDKNCLFEEAIMPHPIFTYSLIPNKKCSLQPINNFGFRSIHDLSTEPNSEFYDIIIIGGSVADSFFHYSINEREPRIEQIFNERFVSPNGKPFRIHNLAQPATGQPSQINILTYFLNFADAFIAIDGFNEFISSLEFGRLDMPIFVPFSLSILTHYTDKIHKLKLLYSLDKTIKDSFLNNISTIRLLFDTLKKYYLNTTRKEVKYFSDLAIKPYKIPQGAAQDDQILSTVSWNIERFKYFMKLYGNFSSGFDKKYLHIVQPIASLYKPQTKNEKTFHSSDLSKAYKKLHLELTKSPFKNTISFIDLFQNETRNIYGDIVHFKFQHDSHSLGYEILLNKLIMEIKSRWNLKEKIRLKNHQR